MSEYRSQMMSGSVESVKDPLRSFALSMAYVPWQQWNQTYDLKKAMCAGTIFPELDLRFHGRRGKC